VVHQHKQRSPLENAYTLFDECGVVIVSCSDALLTMIKQFQWKTLFWHKRSVLEHQLRCFVFGHATYEKALRPYTGLTAHGVLLKADTEFFTQHLSQQRKFVDEVLEQFFMSTSLHSPRDLCPFPLLGMPNWTSANHHEGYYDNGGYFRPGRR
jgi:hypothetical protein